jgi:hypothetical protein
MTTTTSLAKLSRCKAATLRLPLQQEKHGILYRVFPVPQGGKTYILVRKTSFRGLAVGNDRSGL